MATQFDNMIQNAQFRDRANGVSVGGNGKGAISKAPNKAGRKPLGEISNTNSLRPQQNHVSQKQQNPVDFTSFGNEKGVLKSTVPQNKNKSLPKAVKNATPGARKPLGDISNSRKPAIPQLSKKTKVKNANVLLESDEGFLHNHAECINNRRKAVDVDYFFETIGLCKDSSLNKAHSLWSSTEEVTLQDMDLHTVTEIPELLYEQCSPVSSKAELLKKLKLSPPCKSPKSPRLYEEWSNVDTFECSLAETPRILEN